MKTSSLSFALFSSAVICFTLYFLIYLTALEVLSPNLAQTNNKKLQTQKLPPYSVAVIEEEIKARRLAVKQQCNEHRGFSPTNVRAKLFSASYLIRDNWSRSSVFYVDDSKKLLYCIIPKVGSTTWKKLLLYFGNNLPSMDGLEEDFVHDAARWPSNFSLKPLRSFSKPEIKKRLAQYTKVIWIRHPLLRLVSAWNSKLSGRNSHYGYAVGKLVISKYRNVTQTTITPTDYPAITLEEFFRYLRGEAHTDRMTDVHWSLYNLECLPCFVDYDYILRLENWYPEADFFVRKFLLPPDDERWQQSGFSERWTNLLLESINKRQTTDDRWRIQLSQTPKSLVDAIKNNYLKMDFEVFDYNINEF